ncbi:hypothetical protein ACXJJ3_27140 [Kribbella sp. WER1]
MSAEPDWIREVLSSARFDPYLIKTSGDLTAAINLYWWNVQASAAFYTPLHCLEMALRNAMHHQLTTAFGRPDWWHVAPLNGNGVRLINDANRKLARRAVACTADDVVTELTFGFWASLISNEYDRPLWVPCLYKAFPAYRGTRRDLHRQVRTTLLFRNRIMHHEPIHHRHLEADHQTILRLLGSISPTMVQQLKPHDQVEAILGGRPDPATPGIIRR